MGPHIVGWFFWFLSYQPQKLDFDFPRSPVHKFLVGCDWNMTLIFPYIGNNHPNWLYNLFQRGWNHQPDWYINLASNRTTSPYRTVTRRTWPCSPWRLCRAAQSPPRCACCCCGCRGGAGGFSVASGRCCRSWQVPSEERTNTRRGFIKRGWS